MSSSSSSVLAVAAAIPVIEEWCMSMGSEDQGRSVPPGNAKFIKTDARTIETHVNAAEAFLNGSKITSKSNPASGGRRRKGQGKGELSKGFGNDISPPWMKQMSTRAVEIHTVETLAEQPFFSSTGVSPVFQGGFFTISTVPDFSSYSAIFDQYRITLIEVLIEPQVTEVTGPAGDVGEYMSVVDIDDSNTPTALSDLGAYATVVQTKGTMSHYHRWVPSVAVAVYSGAFTSFASTTNMWLDCASSTIQHYGIKAGSPTVAVGQTYSIQARLHCSWRARH